MVREWDKNTQACLTGQQNSVIIVKKKKENEGILNFIWKYLGLK